MAAKSYLWEGTLWKLSRTRKDFHCCVCSFLLPPGEAAFRPINPSTNDRRGDRVCPDCMNRKGKKIP